MGQRKQQRAVIYCRVSTEEQSCDRQQRDLIEYANQAEYQVVGQYHEKVTGMKNDRPERKKVIALAQARKIDLVLVTELNRWGRSTIDLLDTLQQLQSWRVSLIATTGLTFDLSTPTGKLLATLLAGLAEFERDLTRERITSGLASARAKGKLLGRQVGQSPARVAALEPQVLQMTAEGRSQRQIAASLGLSKNTVEKMQRKSRVSTN